MKIKELKEGQPLTIIEISNHLKVPTHSWEKELKCNLIEDKKIQMMILTDGEIEKESDETTQTIEQFYIGKKRYEYDVDTLKTKNIYFRKYSYVITCLIAKEWMKVGNVGGEFDVVKNISIYLQNSKDKKALQLAKTAIEEMKYQDKKIDYSSVFTMVFSQTKPQEKNPFKKISKNVYTLRKTK